MTGADGDPIRHDPRAFWVTAAGAAAVAWLTIHELVPYVGDSVLDPEQTARVFLASSIETCAPEPAEQVTYLVALLLPTAIVAGTALLLRVKPPGKAKAAILTLLALASQLVFVGFVARGILHEHFRGYPYPSLRFPSLLPLAVLAIGYGLWRTGLPEGWKCDLALVRRILQRQRWLAWGLAAGWTCLWVLPGIFTEADRGGWLSQTAYHVPYTMGEFAAVVNGRVPMVDFHSQYQNLSPLLLAPIFRWAGLSLFSFTLTMALLNVVGFLLLFSVLARVTRSNWMALALFLPLVAFGFEPMETGPGGYVQNTFTYYAMGPLRFFGVFALARLNLFYLDRVSYRRLLPCAAVAGVVALNNLDFGIPALAALLTSVVLFAPRLGRPPASRATALARRGAAAAIFLLAAATAVGSCLVLVRLYAGSWPVVASLITYQKTFAAFGFAMMEAPRAGVYQTVFLVLLLSVLISLFDVFSAGSAEVPRQTRLSYGALAYAGVAGFAAFSYYAGRSHPWALPVTFAPAAFALALLVHRVGPTAFQPESADPPGLRALRVIPGVVVLTLFALTLPAVFGPPNPVTQLTRLARGLGDWPDPHRSSLAAIRRQLQPGDEAVIIAADAHWLALKAGVDNHFPFSHFGSLLIQEQLDRVMDSIERLPGQPKVLGGVPRELEQRFRAAGFTNVDPRSELPVWEKRR